MGRGTSKEVLKKIRIFFASGIRNADRPAPSLVIVLFHHKCILISCFGFPFCWYFQDCGRNYSGSRSKSYVFIFCPENSGTDKKFDFPQKVQTGSEAHAASFSVGTGVPSPGVNRLGSENNHSPPSTSDVKCVYSCWTPSWPWRGKLQPWK